MLVSFYYKVRTIHGDTQTELRMLVCLIIVCEVPSNKSNDAENVFSLEKPITPTGAPRYR